MLFESFAYIFRASGQSQNRWVLKQKMVDIFMYTIWVALVVSLSYVNSGGTSRFRLFNSIKDQFSGSLPHKYKDVSNYEKFWGWFNNTAIPALYADTWYNGEQITWNEQRFLADRANFVIGVPYLYQVRSGRHKGSGFTESDELDIAKTNVFSLMNETYSTVSFTGDNAWDGKELSKEETEQRLTDIANTTKYYDLMYKKPWVHLPKENISNFPVDGKLGTYDGSGYGIQLGNKKDKTQALAGYLSNSKWIDSDTRAIVLELTTFNPAWNLMASCIFWIEYPEIGAAIPYLKIKPFRFYELAQDSGYINIALFAVFGLVTLIDLYRLMVSLKRRGFHIFITRFWNLVALVSIVFSFTAVGMYIKKMVDGEKIVQQIQADPFHYNFIGLRNFSQLHEQFITCLSFVVYFAIMRYLKILNFNVRIKALAGTIKLSIKKLTMLIFMMLLYLMAFSTASYMIFNKYEHNFQSFGFTWMHLFEVFLGKFAYTKVMNGNEDLIMQIFYVCYSMIAVFLLLNMVVAVLDNSIHSAQEKYEDEKDKLALLQFISDKATTAMVKLGKESELDKNIKDANQYIDSRVEVLELRIKELNKLVDEIVDKAYEEELKGDRWCGNSIFNFLTLTIFRLLDDATHLKSTTRIFIVGVRINIQCNFFIFLSQPQNQ